MDSESSNLSLVLKYGTVYSRTKVHWPSVLIQNNLREVLVLIREDFRTKCEVICELLWIRAKFRESLHFSSKSEDNSEWSIQLALNQTKSVQNKTWLGLGLSTKFPLEIAPILFIILECGTLQRAHMFFSLFILTCWLFSVYVQSRLVHAYYLHSKTRMQYLYLMIC